MEIKKELKKILFNHSGMSVELYVDDTLYRKVIEEPNFGTELLFKAVEEKKNATSKSKSNTESSEPIIKGLSKTVDFSEKRKWDDDSVVLLLTTLLNLKDDFKVALKRRNVFKKVHEILLSKGLTFSFQEMMKKYQNLMQTYRRVRLKLETEGEGRYSWPYFELVHELDREIKSYLMEKHLLVNPGAAQEWNGFNSHFTTNSPDSSANEDDTPSDSEMEPSSSRLLPLIEDEEIEWKGEGLKRKLSEIEMYSQEKKSRIEKSQLDKLDEMNNNLLKLNETCQRIESHLCNLFKVLKKKVQL